MNYEISPKAKAGINELSPRKFPRSPILSPRKQPNLPIVPKTPPQWKKPEDVMRSRRMRLKQTALTARMKSHDLFCKNESAPLNPLPRVSVKRTNPFRCASDLKDIPTKKVKEHSDESKNDASLFQLLGLNSSQESDNFILNFTAHIDAQSETQKEVKNDIANILVTLPIDWTLRYKMKFISSVTFPWNQTLKTCEEASGITGFVRCIEDDRNGLNSSPNVEFHQFCHYWQHPNLPWLQLFPRTHLRRTDPSKTPLMTAFPHIKDHLQRDWSESFRSLFQLLRARQCPYFYLVTNSFNGLFRAAGINGSTETNAIISPTTRGFRKLLAGEAVDFSMPLRAKHKRSSQDYENGIETNDENENEEEEVAGEARDWLASLGVGEEEIKKISDYEANNEFNNERKMDGNDESLIYVEGSAVNALFNFLINCRTIIVTTGPLAGIPPTLLSPVAFQGGTLASLKVRQSTVNVESENFFSLEVNGPVLPHTVHNLCNILRNSVDKFSVTFANIESSKAISLAARYYIDQQRESESKNNGQAFNIENLSDCGLKAKLLSLFCSCGVQQYDCIKYSENSFVCT